MIQQNKEDYLRAIYYLWENNREIRSIDLANYLDVSKPSVSEMLKKMKQQKLIKKTPYSSVSLTTTGMKKAKQLTYKHRIIEVFLSEVLEIEDIKKNHNEAHKLEHAFSDEVIEKLAKYLKNPKNCPGGKKILKN